MTAETATVTETLAPKTKAVKAKPAAKKTPAKAKSAAKATTNGGLRKPQYRILKALAKGKPLTRAQLAEKAPVDVAACVEYVGSHDEATRKANDKKHFPSLISLGLVRFGNDEDAGAAVYEITAKGKTAAEKAPKA